jgi:rusticyanin
MTRKRTSVLAGVAMLAAAGLGTGVAIAVSGSPGQPAAATSPAAAASTSASSAPGYSWYRSMMSGYVGGGMMMGGSSNGWMTSQAGYQWMIGGTSAPGWMRGGTLPAMMGIATGADPGTVMGTLYANAPGPRVSPAAAERLGSQPPGGATIDRAARMITFTGMNVNLVMLASPSMPAESFRIAGMTNPRISVPAGAHVSIELINADSDMAHGLVVTAGQQARSTMPMMTAVPAFSGSALWFLGQPTAAGMHAGTLTFTATTPGSYQYLCPVPGHAREGMAGRITVR